MAARSVAGQAAGTRTVTPLGKAISTEAPAVVGAAQDNSTNGVGAREACFVGRVVPRFPRTIAAVSRGSLAVNRFRH